VKRADQSGILEAWVERERPIRERKVGTSGTKGVGEGIGGVGMRAWRLRAWFWWRLTGLRRVTRVVVWGRRRIIVGVE